MSDQERLLLHPGPHQSLSRSARWRRDIAELLESSEFHWSRFFGLCSSLGLLADTFLSCRTAFIGLTSADAVFVVSEVAWDLFVRDDCSEEAREEPPIIDMASMLSIVITCEL
jgi:hypothetical protein